MDIAAVVVLYHPEPGFESNIISYAEYTDSLIVVDNSEKTVPNLVNLRDKFGKKFHLIRPGKNMGIAWALNVGTKMAIEAGANWILTMDQDSSFEKTEIQNYLARIPEFENKNIGIAGPNHDGLLSEADVHLLEKDSVITSGCLFKNKVFELTSGFDEQLFIDGVDHEFCFHAKSLGIKVVQCMDIHLSHQLGKNKWVNIPFKGKSNRVFHSPKRLYFMVRNSIYISKKYKTRFPATLRILRKDVLHRIKNHLFFGKESWKYFKMIFKGIIDGYNNRMKNPFFYKK